MSEIQWPLSQAYQDRLAHDYGAAIADELTRAKVADIPEQPGESIPYVRVGSTGATAERPILYVNGYMAGITAGAPFAGALAARGFDVIMTDQNRHGLLRDPTGGKNAAYTQAIGVASVIEAEGLGNEPLNVVTHSYGSLVFDALEKIAAYRQWQCFKGSTVVLMAPAAVRLKETFPGFMARYAALMRAGSSMERFDDSYWEFADEMMQPGQAHFNANRARALREGWEIMHRRADLPKWLDRGVSRVVLAMFGEDRLYSQKVMESTLPEVLGERVIALCPVSLAPVEDGGIRSGRGADHNDQQFNPQRVADSIAQVLRLRPS